MGDLNVEVQLRGNSKESWKPFLRQLLVCSGVWSSYFVYGLMVGAPTVFIPQIRKEANSTEVIDKDLASWLTSVMNFSGFPCVIILTFLTRRIGRKLTFIIACVDTFLAFLVFYCSSSIMQVLVSEIMQGLFTAAQIVISIMILTEYTSPKYRGLFLTIKSATMQWGIWASNVLGTFFHWKTIGLAGIVCVSYTLITVLIWPESPYWLASKERYKECEKSHRWLKGCDEAAEKELETLINTQKEYVRTCSREKTSLRRTVQVFFRTITASEFYKPTLLSILTGVLSVFSGKLVCAVYAIDILTKITGKVSTAYTGMLILDGITVMSMYLGCILSRFLRRRVLLLGASAIGITFLFITSLYLYLIRLSVISENNYVSLSLLMLYSVGISCGPLTMSTAVYGELIPVRSRNLATCIIALIGKLLNGTFLKLAPYIFSSFGLHGAFFFFAVSSSVLIILLYIYLPESKDKTLQEIADSIAGVTSIPKYNKRQDEVSTLVDRT